MIAVVQSVRLFFLFFALVLCNCQSGGTKTSNEIGKKTENLTVSAAASLKNAFDEIGELYRAKTGVTISFNYASSGALQKQIETGAPVDAFASAGERQMNELAGKNLIDMESHRNFARNTLVLIVPSDSKLSISAFSDLTKSEVQKIAVGNPKTVPAGQYAEETFIKMNLQTALQPKLLFTEDVRQVLDYVARGEADAGIVYATDAAATTKVRVVATADASSHASILYPIAVIKDSGQKQAAKEFINLVVGAEGQTILRKYGFAGASEK